MAATPVRLGKKRGDKRPWQVKAYEPTKAYPRGYVHYKDAQDGKWHVERPLPDETLDEAFDRVEAAVDTSVTLRATTPSGQQRTMSVLADRYIQSLRDAGKSPNYIHGRENIADLWVKRFKLADGRMLGDLPVSDWTPARSREVITKARATVAPGTVENIGVVLSGMRRVARQRDEETRVRWMSREDDPLEGVTYSRSKAHSTVANAHANFIPPKLRPTLPMVRMALEAAERIGPKAYACQSDWFPLLLAIAAFTGQRQAEQLALRADDVDLTTRSIDINGRWYYDRQTKRHERRALTKTQEIRVVEYPASIHEALAARVKAARAEAAERRRAALAAGVTGRALDLVSEAWLFPHPVHGVPPTKEQINDLWHLVRDDLGPDAWPTEVLYRNFRHHAATWFMETLELTVEEAAALLGDDPDTVRKHYLIPGADLRDKVRALMAKH